MYRNPTLPLGVKDTAIASHRLPPLVDYKLLNSDKISSQPITIKPKTKYKSFYTKTTEYKYGDIDYLCAKCSRPLTISDIPNFFFIKPNESVFSIIFAISLFGSSYFIASILQKYFDL
jgi:hypothetical protein